MLNLKKPKQLTLQRLKVLGDYILVEPELANKTRITDSGFILTDRMTPDGKKVHAIPKSGFIRAIGADVEGLEVGQRIVFHIEKVIGVRLNPQEGYLIIKPDQVRAVLNTEAHVA